MNETMIYYSFYLYFELVFIFISSVFICSYTLVIPFSFLYVCMFYYYYLFIYFTFISFQIKDIVNNNNPDSSLKSFIVGWFYQLIRWNELNSEMKSCYMYERVIELFSQLICSKLWFIQEQNKWEAAI